LDKNASVALNETVTSLESQIP